MAKVSYIDLDPGFVASYNRTLQPGDRFINSHVVGKILPPSYKKIVGLTKKSLLPQVATAWAQLTSVQKAAWTIAGAVRNLNGYRLYTQDKVCRLKQSLSGNATPTILHQSWVGQLHVESPATELRIAQFHPEQYWTSQPVTGKKGMRQLVSVTEPFTLPLTISLSYHSDLTSIGAGAYAKYYAQIWHSYQGLNLLTNLEVPFSLSHEWETLSNTISSVRGYVAGYTLFIEIYNARGDLYIDNVKATHNGLNWVRDTYCEDINQGFTKAFYQVPKNWVGDILPDGTYFDSVYRDF